MIELIDRQGVIDRLKKAEDVFRQNGAKLEANGIHYASELVESDIEIPTVECEILTEEAYSDLCLRASRERPQGEWIECTKSGMPLTEYGRMMGEKWYGFKCSRCKYIYKGNALVESPYCQECGADMRGKKNECI